MSDTPPWRTLDAKGTWDPSEVPKGTCLGKVFAFSPSSSLTSPIVGASGDFLQVFQAGG